MTPKPTAPKSEPSAVPKRDSDAIWKLKMQIGHGLMRQGPAFFHTEEAAELQRMIREVREQEERAQP
jgi:hypothetical protein